MTFRLTFELNTFLFFSPAGRTPLMYAANAGDSPAALEAAAALLAAGAPLGARDGHGWTALQIVMAGERGPSWRCSQMTELLLAAGADAAHVNFAGDSALALMCLHTAEIGAGAAGAKDLLRAARALLAAPGGAAAALLTSRNDIGYCPLTIELRLGARHPVVALLKSAYAAAGLADFAEQVTG